MESRVCRKCGVEKPFSDYHSDSKGRFGIAARCKSCKNGARRKKNEVTYITNGKRLLRIKVATNGTVALPEEKPFVIKPIAEEINEDLDKLYQKGRDKLSVPPRAEEIKHTGEFKECDLCQEYKQRLAKPDIFSLIPKILTKGHFSISFFPNGKINLRIHESKERNFHGKDLIGLLKDASKS